MNTYVGNPRVLRSDHFLREMKNIFAFVIPSDPGGENANLELNPKSIHCPTGL